MAWINLDGSERWKPGQEITKSDYRCHLNWCKMIDETMPYCVYDENCDSAVWIEMYKRDRGLMMLKRHIHWDKIMLCLTVLWLN